jgi:hypothetical protein
VEDDHFKDWKHNSSANLKLLYGESEVFNGMRVNHRSKLIEPVMFYIVLCYI